MKKLFLFFIVVVLSGGYLFAQNEASTITFVNTGKMFIGGDATHTALYVPDAVRMLDNDGNTPEIYLDEGATKGRWDIGGNFYQDSYKNVFKLSPDGYCYGMVRFVDNRGKNRYIEPLSTATTFKRNTSWVAFPSVVLETTDTLVLPAQMGIDVSEVHSINSGKLLLKSEDINGKVYDASLRVRFSGTSSSLVDPGMVVVEKWMKTYRLGEQLFGFATPFNNTQKSGYFAGNWVRKPEQGVNMHTEYYLGNKPSVPNPNIIDLDQYVIDPNFKLDAGRAYLIKPRPAGFDYSTLVPVGLQITGANNPIPSAYDQDKFVFNGVVYQLPFYQEQLFAEDNLPIYKFSQKPTTGVSTNWLMGNSYTCAISLDSLIKYMSYSDFNFNPTMYVFPYGSQTYQPLKINDDITLLKFGEIPAMSIFMVRPTSNQPLWQTGEFKVSKNLLVHSIVDHGQTSYYVPSNAPGTMYAPHSGLNNQVIFRLTTADNESNFDVTAIGLRANGTLVSNSSDVSKVYMAENAGFQLYTLSAPAAGTGVISKTSVKRVPFDVETVPMNVKPLAYESKTMVLSVEGVETLTSPDFWIEDLQTGATHRFVNGEPYVFTTQIDDPQERFLVHFNVQPVPNDPTGTEYTPDTKLNIYAVGKEIFIENLLQSDIGANAAIYDVAGKLLDTFKVTKTPTMSYMTNGLISGTYIMRLFRTNSAEALKLIIR